MILYDAVLNAPDRKTRKDALDKYKIELLAEGMEKLSDFLDAEFSIGRWLSAALDDPEVCGSMKLDIVAWFTAVNQYEEIRQAAKELEKSNEL